MPTIAIVGAGRGLGLSIAKLFGSNGFDVALFSRRQNGLDELVTELSDQGIKAAGFQVDIADHDSLALAIREAAERFGPIDVLSFSPHAGLDRVAPADVTVEALRAHMDVQLYGAVTAVHEVLPSMLERGSGTLLFTMGIGSVEPMAMLATLNPPQAALRNWAKNLHNTLGDKGIQSASVVVAAAITTETLDYPHAHPDEVAKHHWQLYTDRDQAEHIVTGG
ncbi:SDR family NAD(P)-dependent oxidoreductase [Millisia brevis]|uniref:SDR family NAD(P)-dependent oxidoreductase n=1 Tax=Millisia brevis TaxID=264148 RepID=UPI000830DF3E|nr:SDR family NAD(P)-dependent oxidoreductase [Millisia brevis]